MKKGFTLIELMVVVIILSILAVVLAPRIPRLVNKAKEGATKGGLSTLRSAINIYYSDNDGNYPTGDAAAIEASLVPEYLKKLPKCSLPLTGHTDSTALTVDPTASPLGNEDLGQWQYGNNSAVTEYFGEAWIECTHTTVDGTEYWTSF